MNIFKFILLLIFFNIVPLWNILNFPLPIKIAAVVFLSVFFISELFRPVKDNSGNKRLKTLKKGSSLLKTAGITASAEIIILILFLIFSDSETAVKVFSAVMPLIPTALMIFLSMSIIIVSSRQSKPSDYILLFMFWWLPFGNIFLFRRFYKNAVREYMFECGRIELENSRKENEICKTKYPILLVHGIFFRDWQLMNYWGRIPSALQRNGAEIFYGHQQSAQSVADSAEELKDTIIKVIKETGAEKVNIIAHSKGGLDSRYALSRLGMDKYTATLTTINTPHRGCDMVDCLLEKLPSGAVRFIEKRYNRIFTVLGDKTPDFMSGVHDLSAERAKSYDSEMPDSPLVSYRSFMSVMKKAGSAGFPLNAGYLLIKKLNGRNDGLVWEESAKHGEYTLVTAPGKRGISHGDVIDLFRENIDGYDVREFYVSLVSQLKSQGY